MKKLIFICSLSLLSCSAERQQTNVFFDLPAFFKAETEALGKKSAVKIASVNGEKETVNIPELQWARELQLFIDSDINKMAWVDKYEKTTREEKGRQVTTYKAKEEDLVTRILEVFKRENKVELIFIRKMRSSKILNTAQELTYRVGKGYDIKVRQSDGVIEGNEYAVKVEYL